MSSDVHTLGSFSMFGALILGLSNYSPANHDLSPVGVKDVLDSTETYRWLEV